MGAIGSIAFAFNTVILPELQVCLVHLTCAVLRCAVLRCATLCCAVLRYAALCKSVQVCASLQSTMCILSQTQCLLDPKSVLGQLCCI